MYEIKLLDHEAMDGAERLEALAGLLEWVAEHESEHFGMVAWHNGIEFKSERYARMEPKCGTVACALGWATAIFEPLALNSLGGISLINSGIDVWGVTAAAVFFDLTKETAEGLFEGGVDDAAGKAKELREAARALREGEEGR